MKEIEGGIERERETGMDVLREVGRERTRERKSLYNNNFRLKYVGIK